MHPRPRSGLVLSGLLAVAAGESGRGVASQPRLRGYGVAGRRVANLEPFGRASTKCLPVLEPQDPLRRFPGERNATDLGKRGVAGLECC